MEVIELANREKNVVLFDPVTCEQKVLTINQVAKLLGISKGTVGSAKTRREKNKGYYIVNEGTSGRELKPLIQNIKIENEVWKQIPGASTWISNMGRYKTERGIVFINSKNTNNSAQITIIVNGVKRNFDAHYWVCELFLGPKPEGLLRVHKDGNKFNNRAENLQYAPRAFVNRQNGKKGSAIPVLQIDPNTKEVVEEYSSMSEAAKAVFTTRDTICRAVKKGYESMGYIWVKDTQFI